MLAAAEAGHLNSARPALLATGLDHDRVRCDLCPHQCVLDSGELGECGVRANRAGALVTAGPAVTVAHTDAVERKPLYHFQPGATLYTVASPGCTFRCGYCLNHRLSQYGRVRRLAWDARPTTAARLLAAADEAGAAGVAFSYTEPALALELTLELAELASGTGHAVVWKTNGFLTPAAVDLVAPWLDAVNIDIKAAETAAHERLTGAPLAPVLAAVERFRAHGVWVEVSTPLIPTICDTPEAWRRIAATIAQVDPAIPWHLLRFTPDFRMQRHRPTAPEELCRAREVGHDAGLAFVYVERALDEPGRRTSCPGCGETLVERGIWCTTSVHIVDGACPRCRRPVPGRWS